MPDLNASEIMQDDGTFIAVFACTGTVVHLNGVAQLRLQVDSADGVAGHLEAIDYIAVTWVPARLDN